MFVGNAEDAPTCACRLPKGQSGHIYTVVFFANECAGEAFDYFVWANILWVYKTFPFLTLFWWFYSSLF